MNYLKKIIFIITISLPLFGNAQDDGCVFKAGAFLRYKETLTHPSSSGLDAYVVSCKDGYYRIVTRKYVPGEKTWLAQNKNIPHYIISETSQTRGYMEREYVLNEDYKAGKKISACPQCRGIGAEYYAEKFVNGRSESVNVTHIIGTLDSKVKIVKSGCSKCYGAGWKVQN